MSYYEHIWRRNKGQVAESLFVDLPRSLRTELSMAIYQVIISYLGPIGFFLLLSLPPSSPSLDDTKIVLSVSVSFSFLYRMQSTLFLYFRIRKLILHGSLPSIWNRFSCLKTSTLCERLDAPLWAPSCGRRTRLRQSLEGVMVWGVGPSSKN